MVSFKYPRVNWSVYDSVAENSLFSPHTHPLYATRSLRYSVGLMNLKELEKIGIVTVLSVRHHARRYYLPLKRDLVDALGLEIGEQLKVKIIGRFKEAGGEDSAE